MKFRIFFISTLLSIFIFSSTINAQRENTGLGIMLGEPTGISIKHWISENNALNLGLAYSLVTSESKFSFHFDYIKHTGNFIDTDEDIPLYYGFGIRYKFIDGKKSNVGARGVIGTVWINKELPFDVFFEVAPVFDLIPSTSLGIDMAIGGRYYF